MNNWYLTDNDCSQYMRDDGTTYEMIESIWLDTTSKDKENGLHEYAVAKVSVNMDDLYMEEAECYVAPYGFTVKELFDTYTENEARALIAECVLEEDAYSDTYIIAEFDTFEEAEEFIKNYVNTH